MKYFASLLVLLSISMTFVGCKPADDGTSNGGTGDGSQPAATADGSGADAT